MLNKILIDEKDRKILSLETAIKKFKAYDEKRTALFHKMQEELEEYSEKYLLIKNTTTDQEKFAKLQGKIKQLKLNLGCVSNKYTILKKEVELLNNPELLEKAEYAATHFKKLQLSQEIEALKREIKKLKKLNSELVTQIFQLNNKLNQYEN